MPQPLAGIKIADFSHVMAGPFCTHFLCMLGAEVIKVESPSGDPLRSYGPHRDLDGLSPAFIAANVGKKSIAVDLKSPGGHDAACRLIAASDVVIENFRPGVMQRLGLGYQESRKLRPGIVYCSISGYGQSGPLRDYPAIDNIVQATSGMMAANGNAEDPPSRVGWPVVDTYTGTLGALAVLAALVARQHRSDGQYIDVAMLDASVVLLTSLATPYLITGQMLARTGDTGYSGSPTAGLFVGSGGSRISLGAVQNNQFVSLCRVIGKPELAHDPRFVTPALRAQPQNAAILRAVLDPIFLTRHGAEWERELNAQGVPCGLVRDIGQVCESLRDGERGLLLPTTVPGQPEKSPPACFVNAGFTFASDGPGIHGRAPALAEHTGEVLKALGYSDSEIAALAASRAVQLAP
jgi:crotonobetainyl-CoA:carnitine CoA-transferase CaiB-like acyl-CoA transferase